MFLGMGFLTLRTTKRIFLLWGNGDDKAGGFRGSVKDRANPKPHLNPEPYNLGGSRPVKPCYRKKRDNPK